MVGGARGACAWAGWADADWASPEGAAATGCGFCGVGADCWATAVTDTASRAKTIQFVFIVLLINFRITIVSKVSVRELKYHVHDCSRSHGLPIFCGWLETHLVRRCDRGFIQPMA